MEEVLLPILESSMVLATHYTKACGRSTVTAKDIEYALKYTAQHEVGTHVGSLFPEIYDEEETDSEEDDDAVEIVDEEDEPFTRYSGDSDEWCIKINRAYDTWDEWTPGCLAERLLKMAIDKKNI